MVKFFLQAAFVAQLVSFGLSIGGKRALAQDALSLSAVDQKANEAMRELSDTLPYTPAALPLESLFAHAVEQLLVDNTFPKLRPVIRVVNLGGRDIFHIGGGKVLLSGGVFREHPTEDSFIGRFSEVLAQAIVRDRYAPTGAPSIDVWRPHFEKWFFCRQKEIRDLSTPDDGINFASNAEAVKEFERLRDKFSEKLRASGALHPYVGLRKAFLATPHQIYGELCDDDRVFVAENFYKNSKWKELLDFCRAELRRRPKHELWRWLEAVAIANLGQPKVCVSLTSSRWTHFDERRQHLNNACVGLSGNWSRAISQADEVAVARPRDFQARFYKAFLRGRARLPIRDEITEIEKLWGDRPGLRALKVMYFAASEKPKEAENNVNFFPEFDQYEAWEWGALAL
ncbi:MAG TPA: hypothetical protein PLH57_00395, partial [Oligoflexia bacterium]|nr:hypothetical protein [Oligoflexia bacterium]